MSSNGEEVPKTESDQQFSKPPLSPLILQGWAMVFALLLITGGLLTYAILTDSAALVIGVVGAGVTTLAALLLKRIAEVVLLPWAHERVYRGQDYHGEWTVQTHKGMAQNGRLILRQLGQRLWGECTLVVKETSTTAGSGLVESLRDFSVEGEVVDDIVRLNFDHKKADRRGCGTFLLEVKGDGRLMEGEMVFYSVVSSRVQTSYCTVRKEGAITLVEAAQTQLALQERGNREMLVEDPDDELEP